MHSDYVSQVIKVKDVYNSSWKTFISYMESHSVTHHMTQVKVPHVNPSQTDYLIRLPQRDGRLSWPGGWS